MVEVFKKQVPKIIMKYEFPSLPEAYKEVSVPYDPSMTDQLLTNFQALADADTIQRKVTHMVRRRELDPKTHQKQEYLTWQTLILGQDQHGNNLPAPFLGECGIDKTVQFREIEDSEGNISFKAGMVRNVYTTPFSSEAVDKILADNPETELDTMQWSYHGSKSWGGFSEQEFRLLPWLELEERGRIGKGGWPTDILFHKLSGFDRLERDKREKNK
jgi:hypothetical protein